MPQLPYSDVLTRWDRARAFGETRSLPEYSAHLNDLYGTDAYSQGMRDGPWTRFSTRADQMLEQSPVGDVLGDVGGAVGNVFGHEDSGEKVGRGLPRALLNTAPMYLAGPEAGLPATIAAALGTGALFGGQTYADTGSVKLGVLSGITAAALPTIGKTGGEIAGRAFGGTKLTGVVRGSPFNAVLPETGADVSRIKLASFFGSQAAQVSTNLASSYAQNRLSGGDASLTDIATAPEFWLGQLPFTVHDAIHAATVETPTAMEVRPQLLQPGARAYVPPIRSGVPRTERESATIASFLAKADAIAKDPQAAPDEKSKALGELVASINTPEVVQAQKDATLDSAQQQTKVPINIIGRSDKISNGNYRVLIDEHDQTDLVGDLKGKTMFVNGTEPEYDPRTNRMWFTTTWDKVQQAKNPLGDNDFVTQTPPPDWVTDDKNLPIQPWPEKVVDLDQVRRQATNIQSNIDRVQQMRMEKYPLALRSPDVAAFPKMGITPEESQSLVEQSKAPNPVQPITESVKTAVAKHEQAESNETIARQKASTVPQSSAEIPTLLEHPLDVKGSMQSALDAGASPTQAVSDEILKQQTPLVDNAIATQNQQKQRLRDLAKIEQAKRVTAGQKLVEMYTTQALASPDHPSDQVKVGNIITRFLKTSGDKINDPKFMDRIASAVFYWETGKYGATTPEKLAQVLGSVKFTAARQRLPVESYLVDGKRIKGSEEFVKKYLQDHPDLVEQGHQVMASDKARKDRFYIGRFKSEQSLDQPTGNEGTGTLGDVIPSDALDVPVDNRPKVSKKNITDLAQQFYTDPTDLAEDVRTPQSAPGSEHVADVKEQLGQFIQAMKLNNEGEYGMGTKTFVDELNKRLDAQGLGRFEDPDELREVMGNVSYWLNNYNETYRNISLGSQVPGDPELAQRIGFREGPDSVMKFIASQKQYMGALADIMEAIQQSGIVNKGIRFVLPGDADHVPGDWFAVTSAGWEPKINIASWPTAEDFGGFLRNVSHEIVHHAEQNFALQNTEQAQQYGRARTQALKALRDSPYVPSKVRAVLRRSIENNDMKAFVSDDLNKADNAVRRIIKELGSENRGYWSYIYASQVEHEMMAALFTDPRVMDIALNTPMERKATGPIDTVLTFLSKAFKRFGLGGQGPDNVMSYMMQNFDRYLVSGSVRKIYAGANFIRDSLVSQGVRPEALASRMQTIDRMFARGTLEASLTGWKRESDAGTLPTMTTSAPVKPEIESALREGTTDAVYKGTLGLLANDLPVHNDLFRRLSQDLNLTRDLLSQVKNGTIQGKVPDQLEDQLKASSAKVNTMGKALRKQALALERFNQLNNFDPEGWENNIGRGLTEPRAYKLEPPEEVPDATELRALVGQERLSGKSMSWLAKTFMLTPHLKELYPSTKPVINGVNEEQGLAHDRMNMLNAALIFDPKTGNINRKILDMFKRVVQSTKLTESVSDILRYQNKENNMQTVDAKDPFVKQTLGKSGNPDAVMQVVKSIGQRHAAWANNVLPTALGNINIDNTAILVNGMEPTLLPAQARQVSKALYDGLAQVLDPVQSVMGGETLRQVSSQVTPETYFAALQHAQTLSKATSDWIGRVQRNPGWTSEQRFGPDKLIMVDTKGNKATLSGSKEKLQTDQQTYTNRGYKVLDYIAAGDMKSPTLGIRDEFLDQLDKLDQQNESVVSSLLVNQPALLQQILPRIQRGSDVRAQIAASSPLPAVGRSFSEGRKEINMVDNSNQFYTKMNNWLRNKAVRARSALDMQHPEIASNSELTNLMQQHVNNFLTPDNPVARKIVQSLYFYKLAFDAGQSLLWGTQNLTTGMASLIGETGGIKDAFGYWGNAVKELTQHRVTGKWSNQDIGNLIERASSRGIVGLASWHDFVDDTANTLYDTNAGPLAKAFSPVKNAARKMTDFATRLNDNIGLLAAFELGKDRGMSFDEAYNFALDVKSRGHFSGGKAQRPVGMWSIQTKPVPQLLGALQTYTLGWFSQMAEQYTKGFGKAPAGLTETQKVGAKKAFLYSLGAQAALAGVLGLPGVGQGLALMNQVTGVDVKGWMRQNLAKMFDEDQTYGGVMTGLALRGVGNVGLPFDPSSRASISVPFLGIDSYKGFNVENLGGPVTSTSADFINGLMEMVKSNPQGAEKMLPNVLRRPFQLLQGGGDIRDQRGGLMTELAPSERFMMALGLTPSRVQTQRDISEAVKKANQDAVKEKESFVDSVASKIREGNTTSAQQDILQYASEHREASPQQLATQVAGRVEAQTFPFDPRREVSPGVDLSGLAPGLPSQEAARQQKRESVIRALGFGVKLPTLGGRSRGNPEELDSMMNAHPAMGLRSAKGQLDGGNLQLPSPYTWLSSLQTPGVFRAGPLY